MNENITVNRVKWLLLLFCLVLPVLAQADQVVDDATEAGSGTTLRDAISAASSGETIRFDSGLTGDVINLTSGELAINKNLEINGEGRNITINAGGISRIFNITGSHTLTLKNVTLAEGNAVGGGGAILVGADATLNVENATFKFNQAGSAAGGAIKAEGASDVSRAKVKITNSTFYQNSAATASVIMVGNYSDAEFVNSSLVGNIASVGNVASVATEGTLQLISTLLAGNDSDSNSCGPTPVGLELDHTLSDQIECGILEASYLPDISLSLDSGSDVETVNLSPGSDAINAGKNNECFNTDARGQPRNKSGEFWLQCDVGAYEFQRPTKNAVVNSTADVLDTDTATANTLREAIYYADPDDDISFDSSIANSTIVLTDAIDIFKKLDIDATGDNIGLSGGASTRLFVIDKEAEVTFKNLTFTSGQVSGSGNHGGAMLINHADVSIENGLFESNSSQSGQGGAIYLQGASGSQQAVLNVSNTTFSGNSANSGGAAIHAGQFSNIELVNSTLAGNVTPEAANNATVRIEVSTQLFIKNSVIADSSVADCSFASEVTTGHNGSYSQDGSCTDNIAPNDTDPKLAALDDNGGDVETMALLPRSPLINAANNADCPNLDARGEARNKGSTGWQQCDIGAYEFQRPTKRTEVDTTSDVLDTDTSSNNNSLRDAIYYADPMDDITFTDVLAGQVFQLATPVEIDKELSIDGSGLGIAFTTSGRQPLFKTKNGDIDLKNLTFYQGANTQSGVNEGGAITNLGANLSIKGSTFESNSSVTKGGAVHNQTGNVDIESSTFYANSADDEGGAIFNASGATLTLRNVTISHSDGNGNVTNEGTLNLYNSIIANIDGGLGCQDSGTLNTNGYNLIEDGSCGTTVDSALLDGLADNGGDTETMALLATSPAIDVSDSECAGKDQRGVDWQGSNQCDLGALAYGVTAPPAPPSGLTSSFPTAEQVQLTWDTNANVDFYTVFRDGDELDTTTGVTYTDTACDLGTITYKLTAHNSDGTSNAVFLDVATQSCSVSSPQLTIVTATDTSIAFSWLDNSSTEIGYALQRDSEVINLPADSSSYNDTGLACGTSYAYVLLIDEGSGLTPLSSTLTAATNVCPSTDPQLFAAATTQTTIELRWQDIITNETAYIIQRNGVAVSGELAANSVTFTDNGLTCDTAYTYQLLARQNGGLTALTSRTFSTANCQAAADPSPTPPVPPTNLQVVTLAANSITLRWQDNSTDETSYVVLRDGQILATLPADTTEYTDSGLTCNTNYAYSVYAQFNTLSSTPLNSSITTAACPPTGPLKVQLTITVTEGGTVQNCGSSCQQSHPINSSVPLIVEPAVGFVFQAWRGNCPATQLDGAAWQIVLDSAKSCTAEFVPSATPIAPIPNYSGTPIAPTTGGTADGPVTNAGQTATDITITETGSLSGGILTGDIHNSGLIANVLIAEDAVVTGGGVISGYVDNQGTIYDATISQYSEVCGGYFAGGIINKGVLCDFEVLPETTINGGKVAVHIENQGTLYDVEIAKYTTIVGGALGGNIIGKAGTPAQIGATRILSGSVLEHVRLSPTVVLEDDVTLGEGVILPANPDNPTPQDFGIEPDEYSSMNAVRVRRLEAAAFGVLLPAEIAQIPPAAFGGLSAADIGYLTPTALRAVSLQQFAKMPLESLTGLTATNLAGLAPEVIDSFDAQYFIQLDAALRADADATGRGLTKIMTALNLDHISRQLVEEWLVALNWGFDTATGVLLPPAGSRLSFRHYPPTADVDPSVLAQVELPDFPDLTGSLVIGGIASTTAEVLNLQDSLHTALTEDPTIQFELSQTPSGVLRVDGVGEFADIRLAVAPDVDNIVQIDVSTEDTVPVGLSTADGGFQVLTTPQGYKFTMIPMPQDPFELATFLSNAGQLKINPQGDVWLNYPTSQLRRDIMVNQVVMFDAFIETAPPATPAGIYADRVVYTDGTQQQYQPTLPYPDVFRAEALKFPGVESVIFNVDGTFSVGYEGTALRVVATGQVNRVPLAPGERLLPAIVPQPNGQFIYQVQENFDRLELVFVLEAG